MSYIMYGRHLYLQQAQIVSLNTSITVQRFAFGHDQINDKKNDSLTGPSFYIILPIDVITIAALLFISSIPKPPLSSALGISIQFNWRLVLDASSPTDNSSPAASWGNEDRRSDFIRGPHPLLLPVPLLHLLSISTAFHRIFLLQSCPTHPRLYISI